MSNSLPRMVHLVAGQLHDVPQDNAWLSAAEQAVLAPLKLPKRRDEWRLGRWLAKRALLAAVGPRESAFEVMAAVDGAPEPVGLDTPVSLSITHSHGRGLAAAVLGPSPIGCDLELIEPRSERFVRDWLTANECTRVLAASDEARPLLANLCWSAKESASKVLRVGLRFDTRAFHVQLPVAGIPARAEWQPITVTAVKSGTVMSGVWREREGYVETLLGLEEFEIQEG